MQDFEEIYAQYYALVFKYVMSLCQNAAIAEEIAQETFFRACKSIGSFKGECKISSWLCSIARNCYFSHVRRECARRKKLPEEQNESSDIAAQFVKKETARGIHSVLHGLREPYKEVFWLKTFGELSYREIGELFDKSESWARVTYYRAKIMIREEME